ncbi:MAG: NAD(+) synthase [Vallitaleaceae bacterium]|nr:NAD(+) synthase [Vallitaleaceae bacterium]
MNTNDNFIRVAAATVTVQLMDMNGNLNQICSMIDKACEKQVDFLVFPEMCMSGYTAGDFFHQRVLLDEAKNSLLQLKKFTKTKRPVIWVGLPLEIDGFVFNCAAALYQGKILGIVPKTYLPGYNEFYEPRWFADASHLQSDQLQLDEELVPVGTNLIFEASNVNGFRFAAEICEDLFAPIPPSSYLSMQGALIIANLSASNELISKSEYRRELVKNQSARTLSSYVYASTGYGESTTDLVFGGHCLIAENGSLLVESQRFSLEPQLITQDIDVDRLQYDRLHNNTYRDCLRNSSPYQVRIISFPLFNRDSTVRTLERIIDPHPFVPANKDLRNLRCEEIFHIQTAGLARRLDHTKSKTAILGISGGLDSTLALLVTVKTFDLLGRNRSDIIGVTMPGFGTTDRTYANSIKLMESLHIQIKEIPIRASVMQHFQDIDHDSNLHDITYENSQARERTQILMDLANKYNGLVIGTGDLSELALGWATYNGDHMSNYGVNASIPKTLVRYLVEWVSLHEESKASKDVLCDILQTPVSPELLPPSGDGKISQKTEELVGPYELHDFFLYYVLRFGYRPKKIFYLAQHAFTGKYTDETLQGWMKIFFRRFFAQQFKRSTLPDGPKVGSVCLSPRGDLRMPSDACSKTWLEEIDLLIMQK